MLPNMNESRNTHCGYFGMREIPNYGRYKKPEKGWCSNCTHQNTDFCKRKGNCCCNNGHAPTGYIPVTEIK